MNNSQQMIELLRQKFGTDENAPGYVAAVVQDNEIIFQHAGGMANIAQREVVSPQTNFRLASVAKQFTAMCVMLLRERGQLDYDQPINSILATLPAFAECITIRHLLNHTSGLIAYEDLLPPDLKTPLKDADVLELVSRTTETYFPPGSQFRYSNTGYALLAVIIEKLSALCFPEFLEQNIFQKLGMEGTIAHEEGISTVPNRAYGYRRENGAWADADQNMTSHVLGDGGIYCSLSNYIKWSEALESDELLPREIIAQAWQPARLTTGEEAPYGMGWRIETVNGDRIPYHPGSTTGFNNYVRRIPHRDKVIIVLSNRSGREAQEAVLQIDAAVASPD
jgi:CubicO group peptidase (beta-lactamase class C family)